jgi:uncharacterized protein with HEPN domain
MMDAAKEALSFVEGKSRSDLDDNRMLTLSLTRSLEIIGEAASKVTKECQEGHREIQWASIVNMRNRLIHAYFDINLDVVWETVREDIPSLLVSLERLVPKETEE